KLSLTRQCKLLKMSRSSVYYTPVGFDPATLDLCKRHSEMSPTVQSRSVTKGANGSKAWQPVDLKYRRAEKPCGLLGLSKLVSVSAWSRPSNFTPILMF
ncbi:MAG: hypothetical protein ACU0BN_05720, partial [Sulfitobacter sp.]